MRQCARALKAYKKLAHTDSPENLVRTDGDLRVQILTSTMHSPSPVEQRQATLGQIRRAFERGLLALIVDEDRQRGLVTLQHVAKSLIEFHPPANAHLQIVLQWLDAIRQEKLPLSEEAFSLLRGLGQVIRTWEREVVDVHASYAPEIELQHLCITARTILQHANLSIREASGMTAFAVEVADSLPVEQGEAINLLLSLDKELASMQPLLRAWSIDLKNTDKAAPVAQVFRSLRELSDGEQLADVTEVAWAVENMLDRLIDGTLAVSQDFYAISNAAFEFLLTLSEKLSQLSPEEGVSSFIDDYIYAEIIESADILASGGDLEAKDQEFEAEFPGELGLDQATTSPSAYGNPNPALGLPLSLEETIEVFQGANSALDAALIRLATEEPATTDEERPRLIALLRQQLSISIETSNKLRALVLARNPENFL